MIINSKAKPRRGKNLKVGTFRELATTCESAGTITECRVIKNKQKTELELTIEVMPENVSFYETKRFSNNLDGFSYIHDTFRVALEKKYNSDEEMLIKIYLTGMICALWPDYHFEDDTLSTSITPLVSPACIVDMLLPTGDLMGYKTPRRK